MKLAVLSVLAFASLVQPTSAPADLAFGVEQDATLQKRLVGELSLDLSDVWVTLNGEETPAEMFDMETEGRSEVTTTVVVTDRYARVAGGDVLELLRTYETVEEESDSSGMLEDSGEDDDDEVEALEEVQGRTLRFARESVDDDWTREAADDGDDFEADLDELAADLDHLALLPTEEVAVGDEWSIALKSLGTLLEPGVDMAAQIEGDADVSDMPEEMASQLRALFEDNEITCTYVDDEGADGVELARIELSGKVEAELDLTSVAGDLFNDEKSGDGEPGPELSTASVAIVIEVDGALLWNLDAGRFERFELTAEASGDAELEAIIAIPEHDMEFTMNMGGSVTIRVTRTDTVE
jgi:hypothetical protein